MNSKSQNQNPSDNFRRIVRLLMAVVVMACLTISTFAPAWAASWCADVVPLKLYWGAQREDNFSTATGYGEVAAQLAGYSSVRTEGFVFPTERPDTVPLKLFWSAQRGDNFTTATVAG